MALFCLRFDVDTERCLLEGTPRLLALGERLGVPFTFFVNMGRAVCRRPMHRDPATCAPKLSPRQKLGTGHFLRTALLNPRVGARRPDVVRAIMAAGHEVGLHGGRNHGTWQHDAMRWDARRVDDEVAWGLGRLRAAGAGPVRAFASPGWTRPPALPEVLVRHGFDVLADDHGTGAGGWPPFDNSTRLTSVTTNLLGEPCGVGYLETLRAGGLDDDAILARFERDLDVSGGLAVAYDHPLYAGIHGIGLLAEMVAVARSRGFRVATVSQAADHLRGHSG